MLHQFVAISYIYSHFVHELRSKKVPPLVSCKITFEGRALRVSYIRQSKEVLLKLWQEIYIFELGCNISHETMPNFGKHPSDLRRFNNIIILRQKETEAFSVF